MNETENRSEVARLREQIEQEYLAAARGLTGLAAGTARHDFIQARMNAMRACHLRLGELLGKQQATEVVAEVLNKVTSQERRPHDGQEG